jgi:hypothetical protein
MVMFKWFVKHWLSHYRPRAHIGLVLGIALAGCAGTQFEWSQAKQVQVGTTETELVALLGKPYMVKTQGDSQTWIWSYANGLSGQHGVVSFGMKDGRLALVPNMEPFN